MPGHCDLTGKQVQFGNNVSHSNRKTSRCFHPNLQKVSLHSEALGRAVPLRIATRTLRSVQKAGGLDAYLLSADESRLTPQGARLKHRVHRALSGRKSA